VASPAAGRVALFSIKPQYAEAILGGVKEVEFRRTRLAADVSHVVIYATAPVQKVVGWFEVAGVDCAQPRSLWRAYRTVGGIDAADFDDYFTGTDQGFAIKVRAARRLIVPLELTSLSPTLRPPQSYQYLPTQIIETLLDNLDIFANPGPSAENRETPSPDGPRSDAI